MGPLRPSCSALTRGCGTPYLFIEQPSLRRAPGCGLRWPVTFARSRSLRAESGERALLRAPHLLRAAGAAEAAGGGGWEARRCPVESGLHPIRRWFQRREARRNLSRSCKSVMSERRQRVCLFEIKCIGVTWVSTTSFRCAAAESEVCVLAAGSLGSFFHHAFDPLTPFVPPFLC